MNLGNVTKPACGGTEGKLRRAINVVAQKMADLISRVALITAEY